jgi:hypothetical protein
LRPVTGPREGKNEIHKKNDKQQKYGKRIID